jgi:hypothetical protein
MAKRRTKKEIQGLGDIIANITNSIGIETCQDCQERQFTLNRLFNFKRVKSEMTAEDKITYSAFMELKGQRVIDGKRTELNADDLSYLNALYLYYFGLDNSNCPNCSKVHEAVIKDLYKLYNFSNAN